MNIDLSDVPESTRLAIARLAQLSEEGHSGEVVVNLHEGNVSRVDVNRRLSQKDLRREAARESNGELATGAGVV